MERPISTLKASRLGGVIRYFTQKTLVMCGMLALGALIATLLSYAVILFSASQGDAVFASPGMSFLFSCNGVVLIVLCAYAVFSETRYLAIAPTPRYVIYIGILWKIVLFAVVSSAVAALHTMLDVFIAQGINNAGIANIAINVYDFDLYDEIASGGSIVHAATSFGEAAKMATGKALRSVLSMIEWSGVWYLYICLLRRWKAATLLVTIGTPILMVMLLVMPVLTGWMDRIASMSEAEIMQAMPLLYDLANTAKKVITFLVEKWPAVRAVIGVSCYALAYPVMRSTPQPN